MKGTVFGVEGDERGRATATALVATMGGQALALDGQQMPAYHAACAFASNYLVALLDAATTTLGRAGLSEADALAALVPLAQGALANVGERGLAAGLTGPIRRGDVLTVARHLEALAGDPELIALYEALGRRTAAIAARLGGADAPDPSDLDAIGKRLGEPEPRNGEPLVRNFALPGVNETGYSRVRKPPVLGGVMHVRARRFSVASIASVLLIGLVLLAGASRAEAGKVEKKFGGKILTSDKKFPSSAKSEALYISKLKKQTKTQFWEDKANKQWKVHFAAFFKKPLTDLEYTIKIYDVTGRQALLASFEQYTDSSDQTSILSTLELERKQFGVNKALMITIESRGRVVAAGRFKILGEAERFSGKADFSEEEAAGGSEEE